MANKTILVKETSTGMEKIYDFATALNNALRDAGVAETTNVIRVADIGVYDKGYALRILPEDITYVKVNEADLKKIVEETVKKGKVLDEIGHERASKQVKIVLKNCGVVDPESIDDYIGTGGYQGLKKALLDLKSQDKVLEEMKKSGLRGRGGAGYPTWMKWTAAKNQKSDEKYMICNGDEGDPGAYMDRAVLEGDPHSVVEGMAIAGYAIGAATGYFYIRAEYPLAIKRIEKAIEDAKAYGLVGDNILGSGYNFNLEIRLGAGAFVCGEETALIASIEGKRGTPKPRPPFPAQKGLWDKPSVINNVETLAVVPQILAKGGEWLSKYGTEKSKGTKVFALTGKVKNSGLVEVAMGTTLREIIFDIGGGILGNKKIKAVQTGGPSGGVIPDTFLDTPVDYENLVKLGSIVGSGGMIVIDQTDCLIDLAKFYLGFCVDESCGKCAPCRIGGYQLLQILNRISAGEGVLEDLEKLQKIAYAMQKASLCGLGQTAANPVLSTLKYFEAEYKAHIVDKKCPAGKCKHLLVYRIADDKCKRCGVCVKNCPTQAISGSRENGYLIDQVKCIKCGNCEEVCKFTAVGKE
ncbi:MAG: NADH-ubiquinone oxidoreductase-F iron-sulfur binding region domain-containing protein [Candidatus Firestonebacteria bacterium]